MRNDNLDATSSSRTTTTTYYDTLGVRPTSSYDEIKIAFYRLARKHHPDKQQQHVGKGGGEQNHRHAVEGREEKQNAEESISVSDKFGEDSGENGETGGSSIVDNPAATSSSSPSTTTMDNATDTDTATSCFLRIQEAWEVLRDETKRQEYDTTLKAMDHKEEHKYDAAIPLSREDLEQCVDDETHETVWVYDCRCGQEVYIDDDINDNSKDGNELEQNDDGCDDSQGRNNQEKKKQRKDVFVDCPGCCFVYRIQLP